MVKFVKPGGQCFIVVNADIMPVFHDKEIFAGLAQLFDGEEHTVREDIFVSRQEFVPPTMKAMAYENSPLPIGNGQTISQPFIVALMTELLCPEKGDVILEVGAGSGYQAAILSRLVKQVYTLEIIPALAARAAEVLQRLGYENVEVRQGDGYKGWSEHAPF